MPRTSDARRAEIAKLFAHREREGLTYAQFASECGIKAVTLGWWARKLRSEAPDAFAEVAIPSEASQPFSTAAVHLRLGGVSIGDSRLEGRGITSLIRIDPASRHASADLQPASAAVGR